MAHPVRQIAPRITSPRKVALAAGILYLITFVSIPTLAMYGALRDPNYLVGAGPDAGLLVGGVLELIVGLAGIGTAVALFPMLKWQNESVALGLIGSRTVEGAMIFADVACLWTLVTLRQTGAGAGALPTGQALVALYDRLFFVGQSTIPAVNGLLLGYLLYRSRLVPRWLPTLGLIGAALLTLSNLARLFGLLDLTSPLAALAVFPIAIWEFSLGVRLAVRGFIPSAVEELLSAG